MKKKLLIINKNQLGTLTDMTKWCEYLRDEYDITTITFNSGLPKLVIEWITAKYVSDSGAYRIRGYRFVLYCLWHILWHRGKIMVVYFDKCEVFKKIFPFKKMLLDIRTMAVGSDEKLRTRYNKSIINACKYFDCISVISDGVKRQIGNVGHPIKLLPLGADCISNAKKDYSLLHLLYVGTFNGRELDKTLHGIALFKEKNPSVKFVYDIIGSGNNNEPEQLKSLSESLHLQNEVKFHGRIANHLLQPYFDKANIGVCFVPITEYYNDQPPTKTFEYALSGLYTIATATNENKKIITPDNGILIQDTAESFAEAIEKVYVNRTMIDEKKIRNSLQDSKWNIIVNRYLKNILENI